MAFLPRTSRVLRSQYVNLRSHTRTLTNKPLSSTSPSDPISLHRLEATRRAHQKRRTIYSATGFLFGMACIWITATSIELPPPAKLDNARGPHTLPSSASVTIQAASPTSSSSPSTPTPTNNPTNRTFPPTLQLDTSPETYQLLGHGLRRVSFLSIQVYTIGLYIQRSSIPALQAALLRHRSEASNATTPIADEQDELRGRLLHATQGEAIWSEVLRDSGVETVIRIVPTRNTDFGHLRDAWVRGLTARAQRKREEFGDEEFGEAVAGFKGIFGRGGVPKGGELLMVRDGEGVLSVWFADGKNGRQRLGEVRDERISRGIWLGYLAGAQVSSEEARRSIVEGVMKLVERPVGSVEGQVKL